MCFCTEFKRSGLGAFAVLMLLILGIGMFCIVRGMQQRTMLGTLLVLAVALTFVLQAFAYSYANLGYGLWDTLSFPFLSRGNTALLLDSLPLRLYVVRAANGCVASGH